VSLGNLRTSARRATAHALQARSIPNELKLFAALARIPFIALKPGQLDGGVGEGLGLTLQFHFRRDITVSVTVAMLSIAVSTPWKEVGADRRRRQGLRIGRFTVRTFRILVVSLDRIHSQIFRNHLSQIVTTQIGNGQLPEDVV